MEQLKSFSSERLVAELLGVKPGTLRKWRMTGKGPPYVRLEGTVRYRAEDIRAWLATAFVDTLSTVAPRSVVTAAGAPRTAVVDWKMRQAGDYGDEAAGV